MLSSLLEPLLSVPGWLVLVLAGLLAFAEAAVFVGFVLPGETAVVLAGVVASQGRLPLWLLVVVVVLSAIAGDSVGYEVGRRYGSRVLELRLMQRRRAGIDRALDLLHRRGGLAVFLGRWTAFLRAVMPGLVGTVRMPYRRFLAFNALGGLAWGTTFSLLGYLAGASYHRVEQAAGRVAVVLLVIVVAAVVLWHLRSVRQERSERIRDGERGGDRGDEGARPEEDRLLS